MLSIPSYDVIVVGPSYSTYLLGLSLLSQKRSCLLINHSSESMGSEKGEEIEKVAEIGKWEATQLAEWGKKLQIAPLKYLDHYTRPWPTTLHINNCRIYISNCAAANWLEFNRKCYEELWHEDIENGSNFVSINKANTIAEDFNQAVSNCIQGLVEISDQDLYPPSVEITRSCLEKYLPAEVSRAIINFCYRLDEFKIEKNIDFHHSLSSYRLIYLLHSFFRPSLSDYFEGPTNHSTFSKYVGKVFNSIANDKNSKKRFLSDSYPLTRSNHNDRHLSDSMRLWPAILGGRYQLDTERLNADLKQIFLNRGGEYINSSIKERQFHDPIHLVQLDSYHGMVSAKKIIYFNNRTEGVISKNISIYPEELKNVCNYNMPFRHWDKERVLFFSTGEESTGWPVGEIQFESGNKARAKLISSTTLNREYKNFYKNLFPLAPNADQQFSILEHERTKKILINEILKLFPEISERSVNIS